MSVLIKGMEIPKTCIECPMQFGGMCYVQPPEIDEPRVAPTVDQCISRTSWCPLIEVPKDVQPVKWISVYDQLPDYNMVVLVTDGEDVGTGYRYALGETGFMGWAVPFADIEEDDVSHWMPLPEPPKESDDG